MTLLAGLALLATTAAAGAVTPTTTVPTATAPTTTTGPGATPPHGGLTPLSGSGSCLGGPGCVPLRGITNDVTKDYGGNGLQLSTDGHGATLYLTGGTPWAIAILKRDRATGALSQLTGPKGCITTAHRVDGCSFAPGNAKKVVGLAIAPDGTRVAETVNRGGQLTNLLFSRNPRTGAVHQIGKPRRCLAMVDGACGHVRGLRLNYNLKSFPLGAGTRIVASSEAQTANGSGIAVMRLNAKGRWHELPGAGGCTNYRGNSGCHKLGCMRYPVSGVAAGSGRRVYLIGGKYDTGYVATFRRVVSGGLAPIGCAAFAPHSPTGAPIWIEPEPHSSTVLIAAHYFDHESAFDKEGIYAATPAKSGALTRPKLISGALDFVNDVPALSPDGTTLYGADYYDTGGLYVYHVTPTAVTPLPPPWLNPYSTPVASNSLHNYGIDDTPVVSPDGRFVYVVTAALQLLGAHSPPAIRAYKAQG